MGRGGGQGDGEGSSSFIGHLWCFTRYAFFRFSIFTIANKYFLLLHSWTIFLTSSTLYSILRVSSLFLDSRNRPLKLYCKKQSRGKCVTLSNLKLLLLCFFLYQLLNKADTRKSKIKNLKEVSTREFLYLHSSKSMKLAEIIVNKIDCLCFIYQRFISTGTGRFGKFCLYSLGI